MPDPNKMRDSISTKTNKIRKDMGALSAQYQDLSKEIHRRFREELREQKGSMDGLEDFYQLSMLVKRNAQVANHMLGMLSKLTDISGYNITEETEKDDVERLVEELTESK
jgi:hypothetical protein